MSTVDYSDLKAQMIAEGGQLGWGVFGEAVGVDGETLRQFAMDPKRGARRDTIAAVQRYFTPLQPSEVQAKAAQALALIQQGQQLLAHVVRHLPADPVEVARQTAASVLAESEPEAELPRPETLQAGPNRGRTRRGARGARTPEDPA